MNGEDSAIARIRAAKREIAAKCDNDPRKMYEYIKRLEAESPENIVGYERPGKREPRSADGT